MNDDRSWKRPRSLEDKEHPRQIDVLRLIAKLDFLIIRFSKFDSFKLSLFG